MTNNSEGNHELPLEEDNTDSLSKRNLNDINELTTEESSVNMTINSSANFPSAKHSLKFASLNVCGLKRRVLFPEFSDLVSKYDVFCVCETKFDKYDDINLPGYVFFCNAESKNTFVKVEE